MQQRLDMEKQKATNGMLEKSRQREKDARAKVDTGEIASYGEAEDPT